MASSLMFLLLTVVGYVSAADNMLCIMYGCANPELLNSELLNRCKQYQCTLPQISPVPIRMRFPSPNQQFSAYTFVPPYIVDRVQNLDNLLYLARDSKLFSPSDLQTVKTHINRIKNETNIHVENWHKELEDWYKANTAVKELFRNVSRLISVNDVTHLSAMQFLDNVVRNLDLLKWLKKHLPFSPKPVSNPFIPAFPPYVNPQFPQLPQLPQLPQFPQFPQLPQLPQLPPFFHPHLDPYGNPIQHLPFPPMPTSTQCKPVSGCGSINVTFDVLVGNRSRCKAVVKEPKQKLKNVLVLASHNHACLGFSTAPSHLANKKGEYLYSVDGIAITSNNKWVIKLKSTGAKVDLNTYIPSDGDYFYIDYASV